MKVGICLSGMPRNIDNSYQWMKSSILDILSYNNIQWDIFLYNDKSDESEKFINTFKPIKYDLGLTPNNEDIENKWAKFQNHKFEIEPRKSCIIMYRNIFKCNELRKQYEIDNNIKYDIIIRIRTELKFNNNLDIKELDIISKQEESVVFLRKGPNPNYYHWYKDNFSIMNRNGADIYTNCFNSLLDISMDTKVSTAELILRNWLDSNNVIVEHTSLDYTLTR